MDARCAFCGAEFVVPGEGAHPCPRCGRENQVGRGPGAPPPPGAFVPGSEGFRRGPASVQRGETPWEARAQLGFFSGLWQQWKESMFAPDSFWLRVRPDGPAQDALYYAWLMRIVAVLVSLPLVLLQWNAQAPLLREFERAAGSAPPLVRQFVAMYTSPGGAVSTVLVMALVTLVLFPVFLLFVTVVLHLLSLLYGAGKNGFSATFRVVCYAYSPFALGGIPFVNFLTGIYYVVLLILGMTRVQETTGGRAVLAVLTPVVAFFCCCFAGMMLLFFGLLSAFR